MQYEEIMKMLGDLSYMECTTCQNYFFIHDIPMDLNSPTYCPYCGVKFECELDIDL